MPPKRRSSIAKTAEKEPKRRSAKVAAPKSASPPPSKLQAMDEAAPTTSNAVKEQFWRYIYENRYTADEAPTKTQQKAEERFREKIERMKRIENATQAGVEEILTFEFFNFSSPLSAVGEDVAAEIFLVSFTGQEPPEQFPLFNGALPLRSEKDQRVVYFHVPPSFTENSSVFLVAKVDAVANIAHSRRAKAAEDAAAAGVKETFWGTKSVSRKGKSCFNPVYGNSSINLLCPTKFQTASSNRKLMDPNWFLDKSAVVGLEAETKGKLASTSMPRVDYELSDQHCDEDWDEIRQGMKQWAERTEIKDGNAMAFILEDKPPKKENKSPSKTSAKPDVLLELPHLRCPFTGVDFDSQEKLLNHLNAAYCRLHFVPKDDFSLVVRLPVPSEPMEVDEGGDGASTPHVWHPGPLPYKALAFNAPIEKRVILSANFADETRHLPHGTWKRDTTWRKLADEMALDPTAKEFMQMVNSHMMDVEEKGESVALGQTAVRQAFKQFVVLNAQTLADKHMDMMTLTMAMKLQNHSILTADDYTELFGALADCLD